MLDALTERLKPYEGRLYLVHDLNVTSWADILAKEIQINARMGINACEDNKTVDTVTDICRFLLSTGADRDAVLIAMGGGITTDIAGFAASIYKRGIRFALVPTTLLSMVDAAHGGKTGVNMDGLKNMVGTFARPLFTHVDSRFLATLDRRELLCGAAEMLKAFIIEDNGHYEQAVSLFSSGNTDSRALGELIDASIAVKNGITSRDPLENGERRKLNLGHTIGHAIEWYEHRHGIESPHNHGEAVAIGIVAAARISEERGICASGLADKIAADFSACGLPVSLPYPMEKLQEAIGKDKKNIGGQPRYVLIKSIGEVTI